MFKKTAFMIKYEGWKKWEELTFAQHFFKYKNMYKCFENYLLFVDSLNKNIDDLMLLEIFYEFNRHCSSENQIQFLMK